MSDYSPPGAWMGSIVPVDVRKDWLGCAGHFWRVGILDALKVVSKSHDISTAVRIWSAGERADRQLRDEARKGKS